MLKNKEKITEIIMKPFAECKCAIGKDWYHIAFNVAFEPDETYPDYMDVSRWVSENLNGHELNIEEAVCMLGNHLYIVYAPRELSVTARVDDVVTHFPVEVTKRY